ncbi:hypothetical protein [Mucilaginibacter sp.]|uniref:hypothetical protein n=1 Tax=Mucilaginibacter sp. TaxID=1882438 RepID=UPI002ED58518
MMNPWDKEPKIDVTYDLYMRFVSEREDNIGERSNRKKTLLRKYFGNRQDLSLFITVQGSVIAFKDKSEIVVADQKLIVIQK